MPGHHLGFIPIGAASVSPNTTKRGVDMASEHMVRRCGRA
jgi:hypothetical protein